MCRNCPLPQWSEPIEVEVEALPVYFAKEQSWNFERLNFGNGTVLDTKDGKSARPTLTGQVGTRLRDGFALKPHPRFPGGRYLLVSECLYCPGRRYGCTPRENCTGKRRYCNALCKISVFADKPNIAFVYYSGSHGSGDVSAVDRHRPSKPMLDELRRLRVEEGLTPSQGYDWCKTYYTEHGLDDKLMPTKQQIKSVMKRASKLSRMRETKTGLKAICNISTSPSGSSVGTSTLQTPERINLALMKLGTPLMAYQENGEMSNEVGASSYLTEATTTNASTLFTPGTTVSIGLDTLAKMQGTSFLNSPITLNAPNNSPGEKLEKTITAFFSSPRTTMEGDRDADKLKEFIRILQEENINKISQIADLQVEANILKNQVLELKEDNLRKAIHISQIEREQRERQHVVHETSTVSSQEPQHDDQETLPEGGQVLVVNDEPTIVIAEETPMDTAEEECTEAVQSDDSFQVQEDAVCVTTAAAVQTSSTSSEPAAEPESVHSILASPVVIAQAIIVSQSEAEEDIHEA